MVISNYITITFPTGMGFPTGEIPVLMKDYLDYPKWNPNSATAVYGPGYGKSYPIVSGTTCPLLTGIDFTLYSGGSVDIIWNNMYHIWTT